MIQDIRNLLDTYHTWLKDKTALRQIDQWVEITTPYLDRHNDYVQIYAKRANGGFVLSDDGYTIEDLEQSGCKLESRKRQGLLKMTLNGFGVQLEDGALQVHASSDNFALRKHNLLQAMLAVNDRFYLAVPMVASLFYEDVVVTPTTSWSSDDTPTPEQLIARTTEALLRIHPSDVAWVIEQAVDWAVRDTYRLLTAQADGRERQLARMRLSIDRLRSALEAVSCELDSLAPELS